MEVAMTPELLRSKESIFVLVMGAGSTDFYNNRPITSFQTFYEFFIATKALSSSCTTKYKQGHCMLVALHASVSGTELRKSAN